MIRLTEQQRRAIFRATLLRGAEDPRMLKRMVRGGPIRSWAPRLADMIWGCRTDRLATAKCVFSGPKYQRLIEALPPEEVALVALRIPQLRYAREREIPVRSLFDGQHALARNFPTVRDPDLLDRVFDSLVQSLSGKPGRTLVLQTDFNPINRLLLFAAREAGLRSVCIQHGVLSRQTPAALGLGWYADFTMVYDRYQRSLFEARGLDRTRLPILGFYESPTEARLPAPTVGAGRRICMLGQPFGRNDVELGEQYVGLLRRVFGVLRSAGIEPALKPHPREAGEPYLREFAPRFDGTIHEALERFDVFLSTGSTALLEATLAGRVAIQLHDDRFGMERLDEAPYAYTLPVKELDELPSLCASAMPVDNPELALASPQELATHFVSLLENLGPIPEPYADPPN